MTSPYETSATTFGRTLGQSVTGIRVVDRASGTRPGLARSLARSTLAVLPFGLYLRLPLTRSGQEAHAALEEVNRELQLLEQQCGDDRERFCSEAAGTVVVCDRPSRG